MVFWSVEIFYKILNPPRKIFVKLNQITAEVGGVIGPQGQRERPHATVATKLQASKFLGKSIW